MSRPVHTTPPRTPPPGPKNHDRTRPAFDPALTGLAWALATAAGRIPVLP